MSEDLPAGYPRIAPYLFYEDVAAALGWLSKAFGFHERLRTSTPDGDIGHAEMELGAPGAADGVVMLGRPSADYRNPRRTGHVAQLIHVYVDDVDAHFERAQAAGATILAEPETKPYGDRNYMAADPEGHNWSFAQHVRDVPPEEYGGTTA